LTAAIALENATIAVGGRTVLRHVGFAVEEGEFIGLLGPNGAGKTTLIRAILGLAAPVSGSVSVFGAPAATGRAGIGYLPQVHSTGPEIRLSGRDFIATSIRGNRPGLPRLSAADRAALEEALDLVGAREIALRPFNRLSGGERQRLLIAQSLIGRPRLLLLDEPLISLDPRRQREIVELVRDLARSMRITVLFSAHDINQLLGAIDRVLYLGNGQATLGPVEEVITAPILSRLYGSPIEVVRTGGRIFVLSGAQEVEADAHLHDHGHGHHHHGS